MTSSMIERAARALLRERLTKDGHIPSAAMEATIDQEWPAYVRYVRVALAAMREPDGAMLLRALGSLSQHDDRTPASDTLGAIWRDMIDAALGEKN